MRCGMTKMKKNASIVPIERYCQAKFISLMISTLNSNITALDFQLKSLTTECGVVHQSIRRQRCSMMGNSGGVPGSTSS
jgi:hypothetical protein